jgi:hypothetical protein
VDEVGWANTVNANMDNLDTAEDTTHKGVANGYAGLDGSGALPNGTAATTQTAGDNSTKLATTAFVTSALAGVSSSWSSLTAPSANLTLANAGFTTEFDQTSNVSWTWKNTTVGSNVTTNASPVLTLVANYWTGAASAADSWTIGASLASGTNGASTLTFAHTGSSGAAKLQFPNGTAAAPSLTFANGATTGFFSVNAATLGFNTSQTAGGGIQLNAAGVTFGVLACDNSNGMVVQGGGSQNVNHLTLIGRLQTPINTSMITLGSLASVPIAGVSGGVQTAVTIGNGTTNTNGNLVFAPATSATFFVALSINPVINQTGSASGGYTALLVNVVETSVLGATPKLLLDLQAGASGGVSKFSIDNTGKVVQANGEATAGVGNPYIRGTTAQRAEVGADANVLTVAPAAAVGTYRITVVISVSAATAATIGWTATWTDSNGNAQAPTNLALIQSGAAAPALTFTTSAAGNYYGSAIVDVNNAGTNIVVKTTFAGTSVAYKVTATIERIA